MQKNVMQMHARGLDAAAAGALGTIAAAGRLPGSNNGAGGGGVNNGPGVVGPGALAGLGAGLGGGLGPGGMMTGNEVKPHQCQQCLKSFSSNHQLVQHIRVHTGEKPYKCSYCDRRFKQLSHVQQHTRLHTGEYTFIHVLASIMIWESTVAMMLMVLSR
ncbi:hypothetical protein QAD02_022413 [Eretmocerus hayati]|uniref:Uncharacterized protein n=1 Tax=Eretmocerus hayati TaxID=131215 RepID=A0ACC2PSR2_9HYME|nr:hypothetical protein QAD02_022413 [Eretmocerus hayati]